MKFNVRKRGLRKVFALVLSLFVMISMLVPGTSLVFATASDSLPIAQYVIQDGSAQCGADQKSATYNGTVKMNVPLSDVLAPREADMKKAADSGWYPHGREGKNKIAYIEYNITFPETVNLGDIKIANTSSIINGNRIVKTVNGKTVNFKMYLNDVNWKTIYEYYLNDKNDPSAHTVKIEIPYSIIANSKEEAQKFDSGVITGSGDFSFYPSGTMAAMGFGLQTFNSDVANVDFAKGLSDCFKTDEPTVEEMGANGVLDADLSVIGNTEHDAVLEVLKDAPLSFEGSLKVKPIKDLMKDLESVYPNAVADGIDVSDISTEFNATLTLPEGLEFAKDKPRVELIGADTFEVKSQEISGKKITVKLTLKDIGAINDYKTLAEKVMAVDDELVVSVADVKFSDSAVAGKNYTVTGTLEGKFAAKAKSFDKTINFNYVWTGKQTSTGADAIAPNDLSKITATVKIKGEAPQKPQEITKEDGKLPGDILIGEETQHNKVYESKKDASHDFTGKLFVKSIKEEMKSVEKYFNNPAADEITLSDMDTTFTATIKLPDEMEFGSDNPEYTLEGVGDKFEVTNAELSKSKATFTMSLKDKAEIKTYADLKAAIDSVDDELKVTVKGAKFNSKAKADTEYKVTGDVSGEFKATATKKNGSAVKFTYKWKGEQKEDGADSTALTSKNITFTLKYKEAAEPGPNQGEDPKPNPDPKPIPNPDEKPNVKPGNNANNVKPGNEPKKTSEKKVEEKSTTPETGDNNGFVAWMLILMVSMGAAGTVAVSRRKMDK